jgi:ankyrin repeat protein
VLKYCPSSFIAKFVRIDDNTRVMAVQREEECTGLEIFIPRSRFDVLSTRIGDILVEINGGLIKEESDCPVTVVDLTCNEDQNESQPQYMKCFPLLYPIFRSKLFCETFLKDTMKEKAVKILTTPVSTVEDEFEGFKKILDESICKADICLFAFLVKHSMTEFKDFLSVCYNEMKTADRQSDDGCSILKTNVLIGLLLAVKHGNKEMVEFLANLGAPVDDPNVILAALEVANREIVTFLLQRSNKEISSYTKNGKRLLQMFLENDNEEAVTCILSLNCSADEIDTTIEDDLNHDTLLHKACRKGQNEVVQQMLLRSPRMFPRNINGFCPIHEAAMAGKTNVVKLLLQHNRQQADYAVNLTENMQRVKLYHVAVYQQDIDLIDMLEELHIPVDCVDGVKEQTPFMLAVEETRCGVVKKLADISMRHGIHNATDYRGHTALHIAMEKLPELKDTPEYDIYLDIIGLLLQQSDKDISLPNIPGTSILQVDELAQDGQMSMHAIVVNLDQCDNLKRTYLEEAEKQYNSSQINEAHNQTPAKKSKPCD